MMMKMHYAINKLYIDHDCTYEPSGSFGRAYFRVGHILYCCPISADGMIDFDDVFEVSDEELKDKYL